MMERTLIKGACVLTMDVKLGDFAQADAFVVGGKIVQVGPGLKVEDAKVINFHVNITENR
jgi:dihydroorotase-like cyclic amidohydrolase